MSKDGKIFIEADEMWTFAESKEKSVKEAEKQVILKGFNLAFRQRVSVLVRKTLSFSRSIENLTASIWRFLLIITTILFR